MISVHLSQTGSNSINTFISYERLYSKRINAFLLKWMKSFGSQFSWVLKDVLPISPGFSPGHSKTLKVLHHLPLLPWRLAASTKDIHYSEPQCAAATSMASSLSIHCVFFPRGRRRLWSWGQHVLASFFYPSWQSGILRCYIYYSVAKPGQFLWLILWYIY